MVGNEFTPLKNGRVKVADIGKTEAKYRILGYVDIRGEFIPKKGVRVPKRVREAILADWMEYYGPKMHERSASCTKAVAWLEALYALEDPRRG
jgi:hypothetical protein